MISKKLMINKRSESRIHKEEKNKKEKTKIKCILPIPTFVF